MINYIVRRVGYGVLILIGVNLFTFLLFFTVNTPDDMARMNIGGKRVTQERSRNGRPSAATTSRSSGTRRRRASRKLTRHDLLRALGAAVRVRLRRAPTAGATSATR